MSLAGAQDKVPVVLTGGQLFLPTRRAASTHIAKFANPHFAGLAANEVFMAALAGRLGLQVPPTRLYRVGNAAICLVERYDRRRLPDGTVQRIHQEDVCQALGIEAAHKYQAEGGPSLARCYRLVAENVPHPLAACRELLRWQAFNVLAGNADGHGKNLSLVATPPAVRLAPFYDLVCTRVYRRLSRHLAMAVGGEHDIGNIGRAQWEREAEALGIAASFVLAEVGALADAIDSACEVAQREVAERIHLPAIVLAVKRQARRCRTLLRRA